MQRPPDRISPPILFTRPANEWINRVNQRRKELAALSLPQDQKERLDGWAEAEFIRSALWLDGVEVPRDEVARIISAACDAASETNESRSAVVDLLMAVRAVKSVAEDKGRAAALTPDLLARLHDPFGRGEGFRKSAGDTKRALKPAPAERLAATVESACLWFAAESFDELHPVEQASIVYLRLIEIQPFERANERTALVASSLFTLRDGLPLIIIRPELEGRFRSALNEGTRMNTKPMVELIAEAIEQTLGEMIRMAGEEAMR